MLLLLGGGMASAPRHVRADSLPGDPAPPPDPAEGAGDPDWPQSPGRSPKPDPSRGAGGPITSGGTISSRGARVTQWMKWSFRVAYKSTYRILFRV